MYRQRCSQVATTCSAIVAVGGSLGLFGGAGGIPPLTAGGFILAALVLWGRLRGANGTRRFDWVRVGGAAVIVLGGFQLLVNVSGHAELGLILIGSALVAIDAKVSPRLWWAECMAVATAILAIVPLVAYGYSGAASMSLGAAVLLEALALGVLFARPSRGFMEIIFSVDQGGMVARRLLPAAILIPCLLGWLRLLGQRWELYGTELGSALLVATVIIVFCGVSIWVASLLNRLDREREIATEALMQRHDQLYDLYSQAPCGYHSLDEDGVFQAINETLLQWVGCGRDDVIGKANFTDFLTPESHKLFTRSFEAFKRKGSVTGLEFTLKRSDGSELPVMLNATAVYDADGQYLTSRATLFDATELKKAEQTSRELHAQLEKRVKERTAELARSNAELLQKNQENAMFVYGVSHDLRSPLVNLEGFSSELSMVCDELRELIAAEEVPVEIRDRSLALVDKDMRQSIRFIQNAVDRLSNIIDALLRLSRAGRIEYQWQPVDLEEIVERIVHAMKGSIDEHHAMVCVGSLPPVYGDPAAVEQIFANLIGNAVNYLDPTRSGKVEVGAMAVEPNPEASIRGEGDDEGDEGPPLQTFYVKDNGLGIPEAYQSKVFQALKRLHPQAAKGEGVGLALTRRVVERHGGSIWFDSVEGSGTTFYFSLPLHIAEPRRSPQVW